MSKANNKKSISSKNVDNFRIELTKRQKEVVNSLRQHPINILIGGAGTGKDTISLFRGAETVITKEMENLVLFRPLVQSGNNLGYLKGDLDDKTAPYEDLYRQHFNKILDKNVYERLKKKITFETEQFVRGKTFENSYIAVSEAQNYTLHELITILTRLSDTSVIVINGDPMQSDIGSKSGLSQLANILNGMEEVNILELGEEFQMRNPLISEINKRYYEFLEKKS